MSNIIDFEDYLPYHNNHIWPLIQPPQKTSATTLDRELTPEEATHLTKIRDHIEDILHHIGKHYDDPLAVALAAGRYSAIQLCQHEGSLVTTDFFRSCIEGTENHDSTPVI